MERLKKVTLIFGIVVASASMVACGNKGSDSSPSPAPAGMYGGVCQAGSCPVAPAQVATATGQSYSFNGVFQFALIGDQNAVMQAQYSGGIYVGPIALGGTMQFNGAQQFGNCMIQPGTYQITTLMGSQATSGGNLGTIRLRLQGPTIIDMTWNDAYYLSTSQTLHSSFVTMDQGPMYGTGQVIPCNDPAGPLLF